MAIAVASSSIAESASATSLACNVPSGIVAGDLLVAFVVGPNQTATTAAVTGWTLDKSSNGFDAAANDGQTTYYRIATGSEAASYTFTSGSTANRMSVVMLRITGAHTTTPLDATTVSLAGTAATTYTAPSITTATADAMLLHLMSMNASSTNAVTLTPPSGLTNQLITSGAGRKAWVYTEPRPTTGATGTRSWTASTAIQFNGTFMAIRPASGGAVTPSLNHRIVDVPTTTTVQVGVRTTNAASVRLKVGTDSAVTTGVVFSSAATPDADGYATLSVSGLSANTRYYYRVAMTPSGGSESLDASSTVGTFKTAPAGQASFAFNFGSCTNNTDSSALAAIAARGDDLFFHLGDIYYADGTGTGTANILAKQQAKVEAANHAAVLAVTPTAYLPSDHDGMNNNSAAGDDPTAWSNYNSIYRKVWPAAGLPASGVYRTFTWGRVRFIQTDDRSFHSPIAATDNASKTALGATQKQWLKDTITAATEPVIVILQSAPWIGAAQAGDDGWFGATTERAELAAFYAASGKKIVILHGDQHALGADDGTNAPGGVTVFAAAPFDNFSSQKGGPYSAGIYPASGTVQVQQYGRCVVTDSGSSIALAYTGYSADNTARISLTSTALLAGTGTGTGLSVGITPGTGTGVGAVTTGSGTGATLPLGMTFGSGTGVGTVTSTNAKSGVGTPLAVSLSPGLADGVGFFVPPPNVSGVGAALSLLTAYPLGSGVGRVWMFRTPTQDVWVRMAGRGLVASYAQGLSVYRVGGVWTTRLSPTAEEIAGADRFYQGGYAHAITDAERTDLIAGGFAANIELQEV